MVLQLELANRKLTTQKFAKKIRIFGMNQHRIFLDQNKLFEKQSILLVSSSMLIFP